VTAVAGVRTPCASTVESSSERQCFGVIRLRAKQPWSVVPQHAAARAKSWCTKELSIDPDPAARMHKDRITGGKAGGTQSTCRSQLANSVYLIDELCRQRSG